MKKRKFKPMIAFRPESKEMCERINKEAFIKGISINKYLNRFFAEQFYLDELTDKEKKELSKSKKIIGGKYLKLGEKHLEKSKEYLKMGEEILGGANDDTIHLSAKIQLFARNYERIKKSQDTKRLEEIKKQVKK